MKNNKIFIVFISMFLLLTVGCANGIKNEGDKIVVEKRVDEVNKYEFYTEIKDSKEVRKVKDTLDNISWENAKVSMVHPPNYKFHFEDNKGKAGRTVYLWISPNKDKVELVIDSEIKYVQLNEEVSAELFKIIVGKELDSK